MGNDAGEGGDPAYTIHPIKGHSAETLLVFRHERRYDMAGSVFSRLLVPFRHWADPACLDVRNGVIWRKVRDPFFVTASLLTLGALV